MEDLEACVKIIEDDLLNADEVSSISRKNTLRIERIREDPNEIFEIQE